MRSPARFLLACLFGLLPFPVRGEEAPAHPLKPMLWRVAGGDLTKPSYLFGTVHLGSGPLATLHPAAETAFGECDTLDTEIPMDAKTQLQASTKILRKDGRTLAESIGPDLTKQLDAELARINPQLNSTPLQSFKTWAVAASLGVLESQLKGETAMDRKLWQRAEQAGKTTGAIETVDSQLGLFEAFKEEEQVIFLAETLRIMREERAEGRDITKDLVKLYVAGDADLLKKEMDRQMEIMRQGEHKELGERLMKKLLTDRNQTMAASITAKLSAMPEVTHFFAAGTGHFVGPDSICHHLEQLGYQITRIEE